MDIHDILEVPHAAQELLSSERTPTLSMVVPVFEELVKQFKNLQSSYPELSHYIGVAIAKIEEYMGQSRKTRIYALATSTYSFFSPLTVN